jgi:hypothetical protein
VATVQLLGRGTYGPQVAYGPGVSPLWMYFLMPPQQNSILIYTDGSVTERATFTNEDIQADNVYVWIYGGTDFRCEVGSFEYDALTAAGYTWREVVPPNTYSENYQDAY